MTRPRRSCAEALEELVEGAANSIYLAPFATRGLVNRPPRCQAARSSCSLTCGEFFA